MGMPETREHRRAQHVEHQLLHGPGLQPRGPGYDLRPGVDLDRDIRGASNRRAAVTNDCDPQRPAALRFVERTEHEPRAAAGADADDDVGGSEPGVACGSEAKLAVVLLVRCVRRMCLHKIVRHAKGGRAFERIEPGDVAARPGPKVMEAAALAKPPHYRLGRTSDVGQVRADRGHRTAVLGVHHLEEFEGGQIVQLVGARVQALAQGRITSAAAMAQTRAEPCVAM